MIMLLFRPVDAGLKREDSDTGQDIAIVNMKMGFQRQFHNLHSHIQN